MYKYRFQSRMLHWIVALLVITLICVGSYMVDLDKNAPEKMDIYNMHKSFGIVVLLLTFYRLFLRLISPTPEYSQSVKDVDIKLGNLAHAILYFLLLMIPISGILMGLLSGKELNLFNIHLLNVDYKNQLIQGVSHSIHTTAPYFLAAIALLHILGAAKHFLAKDGVWERISL